MISQTHLEQASRRIGSPDKKKSGETRVKRRVDNSETPMSHFLYFVLISTVLILSKADFITDELSRMNDELYNMNAVTSYLAWSDATEPSNDTSVMKLKMSEALSLWRSSWCGKLDWDFRVGFLNRNSEIRQYYLLCRGPSYDPELAREITEKTSELGNIFNTRKVCNDRGKCLSGEPDLERLMSDSRDPEVLLWSWIEWRNAVGEPSKDLFTQVVELMNTGAKNNGYNNIGECWREEMETENLEELVHRLFEEIRPLYMAIHAVVRYKLHLFYGGDLVSLEEPTPAHLLGDMWAQNWVKLTDLVMEKPKYNMDSSLKKKKYNVTDMVKRAEDYYVSLGFPSLTDQFWKNSKFIETGINGSVCHASAANMFQPNDFRMLICAEGSAQDFKVIHHEMGHIQYYMLYQNQPAIFQQGTNPAFHEAIGNAITYGVMTPNHLQRLGLMQDVEDSPGTDLRLLLEQALSKLPEIPFALALEKWRWSVFRGDVSPKNYNEAWWFLREKYQGVKPPVSRSEEFFDPAANFHIATNTPYIRYFLSSILEMQIFETLCKGAIYGRHGMKKTLTIPLHRCDIYGSKDGAEKLREIMSLGSSIHWSDALETVTGERIYSTRPLLKYYQPLYKWLINEINKYSIPVGW